MKRAKIFTFALVFCVIAIALFVPYFVAAEPTPTPGTCTLNLTISSVASGRPSLEVNPPGETFSDRNKSFTYPIGTIVTIKAINYYYTDGAVDSFQTWTGAVTGNQNPVTVVMDGNKSITAAFVHGDPRPTPRLTPTPTRRVIPTTNRRSTPSLRVSPTVIRPVTPTPTRTVNPTTPAQWVPYLPTANMVKITYAPGESLMHVDITFGSTGYRVADPGNVAVAAGINPDGTTRMSNITVGTKIEAYTGPALAIITTLRITYKVSSGDTTYFAFRVNYMGQEVLVKDITVYRVPVSPIPTPTIIPPTPTPTRSPGGIIIRYEIISDWGAGATISVTIINNTSTPINGWTLAFTFPGNQTITSLWNGNYTQSGASISIRDAGSNATIPANGGSVNFGFNISYSGTNSKPTGFTLNGTACTVQ